jgi:hypothetical protein
MPFRSFLFFSGSQWRTRFVTCNYTWQKSSSVFFHSAAEVLHTFFGLFCVRRWAFSSPTSRRIYLVKFSSDHHNHQFSIPRRGAHFTCLNSAFVLNKRIKSLFVLRRQSRGWPVAAGPVTDFLLKRRTRRLTELTSVASSTRRLLFTRLWILIGLQPSAVRISIATLSCSILHR